MEKIAETSTSTRDLLRRVPQDSLVREAEARTEGGWHCWYRRVTGEYWATPRTRSLWLVCVWDPTLTGLAERISDADARLTLGRRW